MSDGTNITDEIFFQDFQEFIDSTIRVNNLKEPIISSYFDSNQSRKTENSIFLNDSGSQIKRGFRIQNLNTNRKPSKKSISIKRIIDAKSIEILVEILSELVVSAIKKHYGFKIVSTILKSKIVLSNKFIKHGLIQVAKKKIKKNIASICKKLTPKKTFFRNKKFINDNSKIKLKKNINSKKFGSNTNICIQDQSNKIKIPSIEDPILFIDDIYNQLFINNFEIFNEIETEFSSSNDTIRMELDESSSNGLILEGRNLCDSIDELKHNNFDHAINDFDFYPDDQKSIPDNLDRKKPILIKTDGISNVNTCFSVLGSIKSLIVTKNLIIVPLILIFINSKYKFFSLNLSVSSSSITLFSAALSSWQLATPSTLKTSLAFTKTLKGLVNNFSK